MTATRLALLLGVLLLRCQRLEAADWRALMEGKRHEEARALCESYTAAEQVVGLQAEGHRCLAALELAAAKGGSAFTGPGAARALKHLDQAVLLMPGDVSAHQERLQLAMNSARFNELPGILQHTLKVYPRQDGLEYWLSFCSELEELGQYEAGLAFTRVLEKRYPKDHRVVANMGAFLALLKRHPEALVYAKRAVALQPSDAINAWNLGRLYDFTGQGDLADRTYRKALALEKDPETIHEHQCTYAHFLRDKRGDAVRACRLEKEHCDEDDRAACEAAK